MRYLLLFLILVFAGCSGMGHASSESRQMVETTVETSQTKEVAFNRLERWAAETYNSANDVIQLRDEEEGTLILRGAANVRLFAGDPEQHWLGYTMTIDVRDNAVRFRQTIGEPLTGDAGYVSQYAADKLHEEFIVLRASALAALEEDDEF